ncbi:hypothetical protein BDR07DRAFT_1380512 [Suillus spraguei]|nr:hypothetical protein BDR07DRAFT_1381592 [Suillus spraguei]KAG2356845.1 hypothetical protein BDR07DRAFT_1380512 [Suillus spraguei]
MSFDTINADTFCWAGDKIEYLLGQAHPHCSGDGTCFGHICAAHVSMPVWTNIGPEDPRSKASPLYPLTIEYGQPMPPATQPAVGPSKGKGKEKAVPVEDTSDDHGRQLECGKHPQLHAMSTRSPSNTPQPKRQCAKSKFKAIISSDDDMELDNAAVPEPVPAPAKPIKGVLKRTRECVPNPVSKTQPTTLSPPV